MKPGSMVVVEGNYIGKLHRLEVDGTSTKVWCRYWYKTRLHFCLSRYVESETWMGLSKKFLRPNATRTDNLE